MTDLVTVSETRAYDGKQIKCRHRATSLGCEMTFSVFLPPQYNQGTALPALYWLSGLTCTDDNFSQKAGAQRVAAELGMVLAIPDTSPRGEVVADDPAYDLGQGAGFYLNATQPPWAEHYRMYDYVVEELPELIEKAFAVSDRRAISGHSMGGHGALTIALKNPTRYNSASAFAPIVNPIACPWGIKAFSQYLGDDQSRWQEYDACQLLKERGLTTPLRIDQGLADNFLDEQHLTRPFEALCRDLGINADVRYHEGYDHSYFFIASFMEEHLRFHAKALGILD